MGPTGAADPRWRLEEPKSRAHRWSRRRGPGADAVEHGADRVLEGREMICEPTDVGLEPACAEWTQLEVPLNKGWSSGWSRSMGCPYAARVLLELCWQWLLLPRQCAPKRCCWTLQRAKSACLGSLSSTFHGCA